MKTNTTSTDSLKKIVVFCIIVLLLIGVSLTYKTIILLQHGKFDGQHRFNLTIQNDAAAEIISFDPQGKTQVVIAVPKISKSFSEERDLGITIDGHITRASGISLTKSVASQMQSILFRFPTLSSNLTIFDIVQLTFLSRSLQGKTTSHTFSNLADQRTVDAFVTSELTDATITQENKSIQIVNATGQSGVGGRLERLITNFGGNTIAVTTGRTTESKSTITYYGETSYTVEKLEKILAVSGKSSSDKTISDILIVLGADILAKPLFH